MHAGIRASVCRRPRERSVRDERGLPGQARLLALPPPCALPPPGALPPPRALPPPGLLALCHCVMDRSPHGFSNVLGVGSPNVRLVSFLSVRANPGSAERPSSGGVGNFELLQANSTDKLEPTDRVGLHVQEWPSPKSNRCGDGWTCPVCMREVVLRE